MDKMTVEIRRAKKTFNIISAALIDQLLVLFPQEPKLIFFKEEIQRLGKDPKEAHVPAANFFETMNIETKLMSEDGPIVVGELIVRKDERLFGNDTGVTIAALETLGIKDKWPKLSATNKEMVWDYLIRMSKACAQVVLGMQMIADPKLKSVVMEMEKGNFPTLAPGASEQEFRDFSRKVKQRMQADQ